MQALRSRAPLTRVRRVNVIARNAVPLGFVRHHIAESGERQGVQATVHPCSVVDGRDTVVALITWNGTYIETGKSVEFQGAHVFDIEDGKIVRWTSYADTALFNAALES